MAEALRGEVPSMRRGKERKAVAAGAERGGSGEGQARKAAGAEVGERGDGQQRRLRRKVTAVECGGWESTSESTVVGCPVD